MNQDSDWPDYPRFMIAPVTAWIIAGIHWWSHWGNLLVMDSTGITKVHEIGYRRCTADWKQCI